MRFLADAGISPKTVEFLIGLGYEADHVRALGLERSPDQVLVERAKADGRVIMTFELDFGDILALGVLDEPRVIIQRLGDERADWWRLRDVTRISHAPPRRAEIDAGRTSGGTPRPTGVPLTAESIYRQAACNSSTE